MMSQFSRPQFLTLTPIPHFTTRPGRETHHGLAGQLEVGHRDCNLLVVMIPGHDFYHITLIFGPLSEAELGRAYRASGSPQTRVGTTSGGFYPKTCPAPVVPVSPNQGSAHVGARQRK